jgi:hypothetical protein
MTQGILKDISLAAHHAWLSPTLAKVEAIGLYLQQGESEA